MSIFDIILLFILFGFVFYGLFFGLIRTLGALVGVIIGVLLASQTYDVIFNWVQPVFLGYNNIGKLIVFLIIFSLVDRLVSLIFSIADKTFHIISIIPFLKTINRLAGAVLGFVMGVVVVGLVLFVGNNFFGAWFNKLATDSALASFFSKSSHLIIFFLPIILIKVRVWMREWGLSWGWGI